MITTHNHLAKLTASERKIAELVRMGLRNRDIAIEVGTTEQVVKNTLRIVYDKIGCDNKLQLAVWLTDDLMQALKA